MKLSHLRDIIAVSELGSLRAAGRHLGVAQPAITRSIREMEHELGVTLFERHAKGVRLTEMGRVFVRRAEAVQSEVRRAREEIDQLKGETTGEVSMALSTAASMSLMPKAVTAFRKRYPDAVLKISESFFAPIERELLAGRIDFYVGPYEQTSASSQLMVELLFTNVRKVVARKGHALVGATSLSQLMHAQWIRPAMSERSTEGDFDQMFERLGLPKPQIVVHARSAFITMIMVANSDLLTVLPRQWLDMPMTAGLIDALDIEPFVAAPMCIVRRHDLPLTPMAEYLCDLIRRVGGHYAHAMEVRQAAAS